MKNITSNHNMIEAYLDGTIAECIFLGINLVQDSHTNLANCIRTLLTEKKEVSAENVYLITKDKTCSVQYMDIINKILKRKKNENYKLQAIN